MLNIEVKVYLLINAVFIFHLVLNSHVIFSVSVDISFKHLKSDLIILSTSLITRTSVSVEMIQFILC